MKPTNSSNKLRSEIEKIVLGMDLGYKWLMSDYASSKIQEDKYEKEGLKEVEKSVDQILSAITKYEKQKWEGWKEDVWRAIDADDGHLDFDIFRSWLRSKLE